jgi:hypothetical protein
MLCSTWKAEHENSISFRETHPVVKKAKFMSQRKRASRANARNHPIQRQEVNSRNAKQIVQINEENV